MINNDANKKPTLAVHKFTSCDGCQLAFLNAGEDLLTLSELVNIVHFAEAGIVASHMNADIAFIEGSISTTEELERIHYVREHTRFLVTVGACATAGGIQALRNHHNSAEWLHSIYASPEFIDTLDTSTAIAQHVPVDLELWGCPVTTHQVMRAVRMLLFGVKPKVYGDSVCLECKRQGHVCVLVAQGKPCMGPVTQTGCGALCPSVGRACYACFGPQDNPNTDALGQRLIGLGLSPSAVSHKFLFINNEAPDFAQAGQYFKGIKITTDKGSNS